MATAEMSKVFVLLFCYFALGASYQLKAGRAQLPIDLPSSFISKDGAEDRRLESYVLSTPEECVRDCAADNTNRICHYTWVLEQYSTLNIACDLCTPNVTNVPSSDCQCVQADGVEKAIISTNRMTPGPSIQVCENDWVVVDVENHLEAQDVTIHWHGILHHGTQYYDGVPYVTQCPILFGSTFRYQFRANRGTQFWHSHTGLQKLDGLSGSLIVRQPKHEVPNNHLYDHDLPQHVVFLNDWTHELAAERWPGRRFTLIDQHPPAMLINGRGQWVDPDYGNITDVPLEVFTVTRGQKYRFRLINAFASVCGARIAIEGHNMTLFAADADEVEPVVVHDIVSFTGERYDFIIDANNRVGSYWIQVRTLGECGANKVQQLAILRYEGAPGEPRSPRPTYDEGIAEGFTANPLDAKCSEPRTDGVCINQLRNARKVDDRVMRVEPDVKVYLPFEIAMWDNDDLFMTNTYNTHLINGGMAFLSLVDGISYKGTPSPLNSQYNDIDPTTFCTSDNSTCGDAEYCECTHVVKVPLNAVVEIVLIDEILITNMSHPFHLHGHTFYVVGMGRSSDTAVGRINLPHVMDLDRRGLLERHIGEHDSPAAKDTLAIPNNGYAVIRFVADNPGFWLFHCHFMFHIHIGMELVIQVGEIEDLPPVPPSFPSCANHLPPITIVTV